MDTRACRMHKQQGDNSVDRTAKRSSRNRRISIRPCTFGDCVDAILKSTETASMGDTRKDNTAQHRDKKIG